MDINKKLRAMSMNGLSRQTRNVFVVSVWKERGVNRERNGT